MVQPAMSALAFTAAVGMTALQAWAFVAGANGGSVGEAPDQFASLGSPATSAFAPRGFAATAPHREVARLTAPEIVIEAVREPAIAADGVGITSAFAPEERRPNSVLRDPAKPPSASN